MLEIALTGGAAVAAIVGAIYTIRNWPSDDVSKIVDRQTKVMDNMETLNVRLMATNDELEQSLDACRSERAKLQVKLLENERQRVLLEAEIRRRKRGE